MISVQRIPIPTSIQVHNIGKLTDETLTLYFESRRSGGGEIKKLDMRQQDNCAVIEFQNTNSESGTLSLNFIIFIISTGLNPFFGDWITQMPNLCVKVGFSVQSGRIFFL